MVWALASFRAIMTLGLVLGIVGLALGFVIAGGWEGIFPVHRNIGLASIILGFFQVGCKLGCSDACLHVALRFAPLQLKVLFVAWVS